MNSLCRWNSSENVFIPWAETLAYIIFWIKFVYFCLNNSGTFVHAKTKVKPIQAFFVSFSLLSILEHHNLFSLLLYICSVICLFSAIVHLLLTSILKRISSPILLYVTILNPLVVTFYITLHSALPFISLPRLTGLSLTW